MFNRASKSFNTKSIATKFTKYCGSEISSSYKLNFNYTNKYSFSSLYKTQFNTFVGKKIYNVS